MAMQNGKYTVLIVEDDVKLAGAVSQFLQNNHYDVLEAQTGNQALQTYFLYNHMIDLVLLDVRLPDIDGYQVLKSIREYSSVPIIMTTSKDSEEDQLEGLTNGADNYITKPFRLRVLLAHIENLLKRVLPVSSALPFGKLTVNTLAQTVTLHQETIPLTPKEYSLLLYFIQNQNKVLSRETILDNVWGYDYDGDIRTVDTLVKQLRKKLTEECPYIHSVYGIGYCFKETC